MSDTDRTDAEDAGPIAPDVAPEAREVVDAVVDVPAVVRKHVVKQRVTLTLAEHGVEGHLDVLEDASLETTEWGEPIWLPLMVVFQPKGGARESLAFAAGKDGRLTSTRFVGLSNPSWVLAYTDVWWRGTNERKVVIDIEGGKPILRQAKHVRTGALAGVATGQSNTTTGIRSIGEIHPHEVLQIGCGTVDIMKKPFTCEATARVYFIVNGEWKWDEKQSDVCLPNSNGSCRPKSPFPDRTFFPAIDP